LRAPSPLTSPPTTGVYGAPEARRATVVSSSHDTAGHDTIACSWWRRSRSLRPHADTFGFPAVVVATPKPPKPPGNDVWSRERMNVYDRFAWMPRRVNAFSASVACFVSDWSPDPASSTRPSSGCSREPNSDVAPVAGTIVVAGT